MLTGLPVQGWGQRPRLLQQVACSLAGCQGSRGGWRSTGREGRGGGRGWPRAGPCYVSRRIWASGGLEAEGDSDPRPELVPGSKAQLTRLTPKGASLREEGNKGRRVVLSLWLSRPAAVRLPAPLAHPGKHRADPRSTPHLGHASENQQSPGPWEATSETGPGHGSPSALQRSHFTFTGRHVGRVARTHSAPFPGASGRMDGRGFPSCGCTEVCPAPDAPQSGHVSGVWTGASQAALLDSRGPSGGPSPLAPRCPWTLAFGCLAALPPAFSSGEVPPRR